MNGEELDVVEVVPSNYLGVWMVRVCAADAKPHGALSESPSLALDASEIFAVIDDEVGARVLPERHEDRVAGSTQRQDHGERCVISDVLWMLHS